MQHPAAWPRRGPFFLAASQASRPRDRPNHKYQVLRFLIFNYSHKHQETSTPVFQSELSVHTSGRTHSIQGPGKMFNPNGKQQSPPLLATRGQPGPRSRRDTRRLPGLHCQPFSPLEFTYTPEHGTRYKRSSR